MFFIAVPRVVPRFLCTVEVPLEIDNKFFQDFFHELIFFFATTQKKKLFKFISFAFVFAAERSSLSLRKSLETEKFRSRVWEYKNSHHSVFVLFLQKFFFSFFSFSFVRKQVLIMNIWLTTDDDEVNYI